MENEQPLPSPAPSEAPKKRGPKPYQAPADRPNLAAEWAHLRQWWAEHGARYNLPELTRLTGVSDPATLWKLLTGAKGPASTAERLDLIISVLSESYTPLKKNIEDSENK